MQNIIPILAATGHGDVAAKLQSAQMQQLMAQQLMAEGSQPEDINKLANPGGLVVPYSPWQGLAKAGDKIAGMYMAKNALADQLAAYGGGSSATPGQAALANGLTSDSNMPTMAEMMLPEKLGTAAYEQRYKPANTALEKGLNTYTDANGVTHLVSSLMGNQPTQPATSQPIQQRDLPPPALVTPPADVLTDKNKQDLNIHYGADEPAKPVELSNDKAQEDKFSWLPKGGGDDVGPPTKANVEQAGKLSESGIKYQDEITKEANDATKGKRIVEQMKILTDGITPGKLTQAKADLAAYGEALGVNKDWLEGQLGKVDNVQAFNKLTAQLAVENVKNMTSRGTQMEFATFIKNNPNPDLNPGALKQLIDFTGKSFDIPVEKQQAWDTWVNKRGGSIRQYLKFDSAWNKHLSDNMGEKLAPNPMPTRTITMDDINAAAKAHGKTPEQVMKDAQAKGFTIAK
ncbi:MAG: hypothetical protein EBR82_22995 [Caulobacteraceae bacterium]|nr:hypothetical protein [Caulobacteraceae bacterium]